MRTTPALAAAILVLAAGTAALAQTRQPITGAPPSTPNLAAPVVPDELTRQSAAEDQAQASAMTAQLAALDASAEADEARMTRLRDWDLAQENARIRAIKPALPFNRNPSLVHYFYW